MNGRDYCGGAHHAPAAHELERAPLAQADDYTPVPARTLGAAWNYEAQRDVCIAAAAGRQRGALARGALLTVDGARRTWGAV